VPLDPIPRYTLIRGDQHTLTLRIERDGQDWSTATFTAQLRNGVGGQLLHTYTITADTSVVGVADLTLGPVAGTATAAFPIGARLVGELKVTDPGLGTLRLARWHLDVVEQVTV
jgi:hypothetical protein